MGRSASRDILAQVAFLTALAALPTTAPAQDAANGRQIAERWCAPCHATQTRGSDSAMSFESIAASPAGEPARMRRFLAEPHPPMPPMQLGRGDVEDLVAYVVSLRAR
jgi:mono/diheme cytochrome c family protein